MFRILALLVFIFPVLVGNPALASDAAFFKNVEGKWTGPGEIVAGKYKGTKFNCVFDGINPDKKTGMKIDGYCRVGMFAQPMNAIIQKAGKSYSGQFLDGEAGEGMDITGGTYSPDKLVVNIKRKDLRGVLVTSKSGEDSMQMTISVRVDGKLIPVIGMRLDRTTTFMPSLANRG